MKSALRVLAALRERQEPAIEDIEELRSLVPQCSDEEMRKLAQEVVNWALRQCV